MDRLIEELKATMEEKKLSAAGAARHIGVSARTVYRWINGEMEPTSAHRRAIGYGLMTMQKGKLVLAPDFDYNDAILDSLIFRKLKPQLTEKEKAWLMDVDAEYVLYRERLYELDEKYKKKDKKRG